MFSDHVVFVDLETTGGSALVDRIIEIGVVEVDRGRLVSEWSTLVNPGRRIPSGIQTLTGITDGMVATAPTFDRLSGDLARRLEGKTLAAHNAGFDYGFLKKEFRRAGMRFHAPVLCTVKLSRRLFPHHRRHNLDALIIRHALFCLDRHRALGDARMLWELAQIWRREIGAVGLDSACADLVRAPAVPVGLPEDVFDAIPEGPGVYIFYGEGDLVLYVGKAANLHSRVVAHFCAGEGGGKDAHIAAEVKRIDWTETTGELGAFIREAQLIRSLAPVYNRARRASEPCAWRWRADRPTDPLELVTVSALDLGRLDDIYGIFRTRSGALAALRGLASEHALCRSLLGLEKQEAGRACSAVAAGRCRGACIGLEKPMGHAMRVVQALAGLRVRPWPYAGRIGVRERDPATERCELHVLDRWCYLGTLKSEADLHELTEAPPAHELDLDIYRMLTRFLAAVPHTCDVVPLPL